MRTTADPGENDLAGLFEDRTAARPAGYPGQCAAEWYVVAGRARREDA